MSQHLLRASGDRSRGYAARGVAASAPAERVREPQTGSLGRADGPGKAHRWQTTDTRGRSSYGHSKQAASSCAELAARECGHLSLDEALQLTAVAGVERPKVARNRWRILEPREVQLVRRAFTDERARRVFLTFILTGLRRSELMKLRWRHVSMAEGTLRVVETKSEEGERLLALPRSLVDELTAHYAASSYRADTDYVFGHPTRGTPMDPTWFHGQLKAPRSRRHHRPDPTPRPPPRRPDEPRGDRRIADRCDGDRGASLDGNDAAVPPPGRRRVP